MDDSAPHRTAPTRPGHSPTAGRSAGDPPHGQDPVMAAPYHRRPAPSRRMGPGRRLSLLVLALSLLATALVCLLLVRGDVGLVNGGLLLLGLPVVILGAGIVASGLRRRHGGWMSLLGWPVLLAALTVLALGAVVPTAVRAIPAQKMDQAVGRVTYTWQELVEAGSGASRELPVMAGGEVVLDLREMPQGTRDAEAGALALSTIDLEVGVGEVRILIREDAPVTVEAESSLPRLSALSARVPQSWSIERSVARATGSPAGGAEHHGAGDGWDVWDADGPALWDEDEYTVDGSPAPRTASSSTGPLRSAALRSPTAGPGGAALTVRARLGAGRITVQAPQEVTWAGDASGEVWVVEYWRDETGQVHIDDDPAVPGMTHPAISARRAGQCVERARAGSSGSADRDPQWDVDEDRDEDRDHYDRDWEAWEELDELTTEQRRAYSDCAQQASKDHEDQGPAATASPAPSTGATG